MANTRVAGRPLFGGVTAGDEAYDPDGSYVGTTVTPGTTAARSLRRVSDSELLRVDLTGPEAFGAGTASLFSVVERIATDLESATRLPDGRPRRAGRASSRRCRAPSPTSAPAAPGSSGWSRSTPTAPWPLQDPARARSRTSTCRTRSWTCNMQQTGYEAALAATAKVHLAHAAGLPALMTAIPDRAPAPARRPAHARLTVRSRCCTSPSRSPGFPGHRDYVLVPADAAGLLSWLQSRRPRRSAVPGGAGPATSSRTTRPVLPAVVRAELGLDRCRPGADLLPGHRARRRSVPRRRPT